MALHHKLDSDVAPGLGTNQPQLEGHRRRQPPNSSPHDLPTCANNNTAGKTNSPQIVHTSEPESSTTALQHDLPQGCNSFTKLKGEQATGPMIQVPASRSTPVPPRHQCSSQVVHVGEKPHLRERDCWSYHRRPKWNLM